MFEMHILRILVLVQLPYSLISKIASQSQSHSVMIHLILAMPSHNAGTITTTQSEAIKSLGSSHIILDLSSNRIICHGIKQDFSLDKATLYYLYQEFPSMTMTLT